MTDLPHAEMLASLKQARYVLGRLCGDATDIFEGMDRAIANASSLNDDMVVRAMAQIPGVDHDDMVRALQAALGLEMQ